MDSDETVSRDGPRKGPLVGMGLALVATVCVASVYGLLQYWLNANILSFLSLLTAIVGLFFGFAMGVDVAVIPKARPR